MRDLVRGQTVAGLFVNAVREFADRPALRAAGGEVTWSYAEYGRQAARVAAALRGLGVGPGDRVSLLMRNCPEFHAIDMGTLLLRATPTSMYYSSAPEQIRYLVEQVESRVVVADGPATLERLIAARPYGGLPEHVIVLDDPQGSAGAEVLRYADLLGADALDLDAAAAAVCPEDIATIIFTSGTTRPAKGARHSHAGMRAMVESLFMALGPDFRHKRLASYLPMAHIAERGNTLYLPLRAGHEVTTVGDVTALAQALPAVRPQYLFGPPRIWEKLWAGIQHVRACAEVEPTVAELLATVSLDAVEIAVTAAAAMPPTVLDGYWELGLRLADGYGMTECGPGALDVRAPRVGTVGRVLPGTRIRLAEDGEIELDSAAMFAGYLNGPERTAEVFTPDGWLRTGDVGSLDADGYLTLVDRKKDLIITAGGKNIAPTQIESLLVRHPLVSSAVAIGEARRYICALIVLDPLNVGPWAAARGAAPDPVRLAENPDLLAELQAHVDAVNAELSRVEQVKRFAVLPGFWMPDSEELTPTMKVRRRVVTAKYDSLIETLYV
jgi:long-chain acyl-CoA synthetase